MSREVRDGYAEIFPKKELAEFLMEMVWCQTLTEDGGSFDAVLRRVKQAL